MLKYYYRCQVFRVKIRKTDLVEEEKNMTTRSGLDSGRPVEEGKWYFWKLWTPEIYNHLSYKNTCFIKKKIRSPLFLYSFHDTSLVLKKF